LRFFVQASRGECSKKAQLIRPKADRGLIEAERAELRAEFLHRSAARMRSSDEVLLEKEQLD